jgi:hypothetical protein
MRRLQFRSAWLKECHRLQGVIIIEIELPQKGLGFYVGLKPLNEKRSIF